MPGGRTAVMFASGTFEVEWRARFLPYEVAAAALWTGTAGALGYFFGSTFRDSFWLPLVVSFAVAAAITAVAEGARRKAAKARG